MRRIGLILSILISSLWSAFAYGQSNNQELDRLDSIAFSALESSDSDVISKANNLLKAGQDANSAKYQINAYTILGIVNKNKGYFVTAVDYYNSALKVSEESNDQARVSACYNNIGSVYKIQENYTKALFYFKKSLEIEEILNNPLQKSIRLFNIGEIYREMDSMSLALSNFNSSLQIEKEYKNSEGVVYALLGVADIYLQLDRPADASISLDEAKDYIDDSGVEIQILYNLLKAQLLHKEGDLYEALLLLKKAKETCDKHDFRMYRMDIYEQEIAVNRSKEERGLANRNSEASSKVNYFIWIISIFAIVIVGLIFFLKKRSIGKNELLKNELSQQQSNTNPKFELKSSSGKVLMEVELDKIICFEANDNYVVTYYLSENSDLLKTMKRVSLRKIESLLNELNAEFSRVHKSYIVNPIYVDKVSGKSQAYKLRMKQLDLSVPVSRSFDVSVFKR